MPEQPTQPARTAVYSELMWPEWNPTSESYGAGEEKTNALLDAHAAEARAAAFREAADLLRDLHFTEGYSVQEIGTALRHTADATEETAR
jgi:hypothetical protein